MTLKEYPQTKNTLLHLMKSDPKPGTKTRDKNPDKIPDKIRPIIFSAEMATEIRKGVMTETHRPVKPGELYCRYGKPRDILWVREPWRIVGWNYDEPYMRVQYLDGEKKLCIISQDMGDNGRHLEYMIECGEDCEKAGLKTGEDDWYDLSGLDCATIFRKRSAIYMPRWASRLLVEITDVKKEALSWVIQFETYPELYDIYTL